jgi:ATP-binding cassette subfamily F protein uup
VPTAGQLRAGQKELARLERQITRLAEAEERLATELADSGSDYAKLLDLGAQLRSIELERADLEERWLLVAEEIG